MIVGGFGCLGLLSPTPTKAVMPLMLIGLTVGVVYDVASGRMRFGDAELRKLLIGLVYGVLHHTALGMGVASLLIAMIYRDPLNSSLLAVSAISLWLLARLPPRVYFRAVASIDQYGGEVIKKLRSPKFIAIILAAALGVISSTSRVALGESTGTSPTSAMSDLMSVVGGEADVALQRGIGRE